MPRSLFTVECRNGPDSQDFPGLTHDRAIERGECERGKGNWQTVTIRRESDGQVYARYYGAGAVTPAGRAG